MADLLEFRCESEGCEEIIDLNCVLLMADIDALLKLGIQRGMTLTEILQRILDHVSKISTDKVSIEEIISRLFEAKYEQRLIDLLSSFFSREEVMLKFIQELTKLFEKNSTIMTKFLSTLLTSITKSSELTALFCEVVKNCNPSEVQCDIAWWGSENSKEPFGCMRDGSGRYTWIYYVTGAVDYEFRWNNDAWQLARPYDETAFDRTGWQDFPVTYAWNGPTGTKGARYSLIVYWPQGQHTLQIRDRLNPTCPPLSHTYDNKCTKENPCNLTLQILEIN